MSNREVGDKARLGVTAAMPGYYQSSAAYAEMLGQQDERIFTPYVELFSRFADRGSAVVDVGCGVGESTRLLRQAGFEALGTDVSERFLPPNQPGFMVANFEDARELRTDTYGAAGAMNVLEHVEQPERFLAEMVRVVRPGGHIIIWSPNLTSPLVGVRVLRDLIRGRTPYLGLTLKREAAALLLVNLFRSIGAAAGRDAFRRRQPRLQSGIVGYDTDATYWTNAAEVRRFVEREGCRTVAFQRAGRSRAARAIALLMPTFAGQLVLVARKEGALE